MRELLMLLPVFGLANLNINAEYMHGSIANDNYQLLQISINHKPWYLTAKTATKANSCWEISGDVNITNKQTHSIYQGDKFKYCQQSHLLSSKAPVTVIKNKLRMQAKRIVINLKNNQAKIYGITANASN